MKLLCTLFLMYVLLLSVRPCCTDDCQVKTTDKTSQANKNTKDECKGCSPFFSCGTCVGFIIANRAVHTAKTAIKDLVIHNSSYQNPSLTEITLSIWQPPQLS